MGILNPPSLLQGWEPVGLCGTLNVPLPTSSPTNSSKPAPIFWPYSSFQLQMCLYFHAFMSSPSQLPSQLSLYSTILNSNLNSLVKFSLLATSSAPQLLTPPPPNTHLSVLAMVRESCYHLAYCGSLGLHFSLGLARLWAPQGQKCVFESLESNTVHSTRSTLNK